MDREQLESMCKELWDTEKELRARIAELELENSKLDGLVCTASKLSVSMLESHRSEVITLRARIAEQERPEVSEAQVDTSYTGKIATLESENAELLTHKAKSTAWKSTMVQAMARLAQWGSHEFSKHWLAKADQAWRDAKIEDMVTVQLNDATSTPTKAKEES